MWLAQANRTLVMGEQLHSTRHELFFFTIELTLFHDNKERLNGLSLASVEKDSLMYDVGLKTVKFFWALTLYFRAVKKIIGYYKARIFYKA